MTELLYLTDAYLREFDAEVVAVDAERRAVALSVSAFFPGGGGQPPDTGSLGELAVVDVAKRDGAVWHVLANGAPLPEPGARLRGILDWERRHQVMRTHTALHVLNGLIWLHYRAHVTGAHMTPGQGRLDFELPAMSQELGREIEGLVNEQVARDLPVEVRFVARSEADRDPSLIRLKANLIPRSVDPLRVIDIVGLDRQADGGTHVASTGEVGTVRVVKTESKGKANKRVRIALD
jgi:misacylated tRNA(Ala) deacylase